MLPFTNMSADPDNEFFSDGITDDVIVALTAVKGLKVAARTSSFAFKNKNADLATVGKTLGVRTVLQGSVRRAGNRVRVTVQLMNASEGTQLWSERYDRELDDIFAIQDEIARGSSSSSGCVWASSTQAGSSCRVRSDDLEAYQLYLRGREAAYVRTPASLRRRSNTSARHWPVIPTSPAPTSAWPRPTSVWASTAQHPDDRGGPRGGASTARGTAAPTGPRPGARPLGTACFRRRGLIGTKQDPTSIARSRSTHVSRWPMPTSRS